MGTRKRVSVKSSAHTAAKKGDKKIKLASSPDADLRAAIKGGDGVVEALSFSDEAVIGHVKRVCSTGSLSIDQVTGYWGFPFGRIVEISGKEQTGKTTLAQQVAAQTQAMGGSVMLYDTEEKWDQVYAQLTGVDLQRCLTIQPVIKAPKEEEEVDDDAAYRSKKDREKDDKASKKKKKSEGSKTVEAGIAAIDRALQMWIDKGHTTPLTIIWDSIAGTPTAEELNDLTDKQPGVAARELRRAMRVLTSKVARAGCLLLLVNQTYEKIGMFGFGPKHTTYGGGAIRYHATMRLELTRFGHLKHTDGTILGIEGIAKLIKNSLGAQGEARYAIAHGRGTDNAWSIVEKLKEAKYISVRPGGNYVFAAEGLPPVTWRGGFAVLSGMMTADPALAAQLVAIYKALP
jgi:recombination protein RecA